MVKNQSIGGIVADVIIYIILGLACIVCLIPLINTLALSFSGSVAASSGKVFFWPIDFTLESYRRIVQDFAFIRSLGVSFARTAIGTAFSFFLMILMAYPLSKSKKEFRFRGVYMWLLIGAMLFSGGLIPVYMVVNSLKLIDSFWSMIIPCAIPIFNVILIMNYMRGLPKEVEESAAIDGANPWQSLFQIVVPMCVPVLTTVTLFTAVGHWNNFFDAMIYMNNPDKWPVQTYIYSLNLSAQSMATMTDPKEIARLMEISGVTFNAAKVFVAMIPIIVVYPFVQRFFVGGIVMGAVKE